MCVLLVSRLALHPRGRAQYIEGCKHSAAKCREREEEGGRRVVRVGVDVEVEAIPPMCFRFRRGEQ